MRLRLKILLLFFLCLSRYAIFGKATKRQKVFGKIVIFQGAKLGDMVCTTPMFRAVKKKYPKCRITVIGNNINRSLLEHNLDVDSYIVHRDNSIFSTIENIKKENVDFGCITGPNFLNLAILYLSGIPLIIAPVIKNGWSPWETMSYKILQRAVETQPHHMSFYAPREYLRLLRPIGIFTEDTTKNLGFSDEANKTTSHFLEKEKISQESDFIVGVSPSAGNKVKEWPAKNFAEVADYIYRKYGAKVVIVGEPNDKEEVESMLSALGGDTKVVNTCGVFDIDELKALMSKFDLFISVDTGPIYIAESFGVPTIDITGPIDEREQPPIGELHRVVVPRNRKRPELFVMNARQYDYTEARRQSESITTEMVTSEVDKLYTIITEHKAV